MEVVKRLEGSEPEEIEFDFKEKVFQEDKVEKNHKKRTLVIILGIISLAILGYFGFKTLNTNETIQVVKVEEKETFTSISKPPPPSIEHKVEVVTPIKKENKPNIQVLTNTKKLTEEIPKPKVITYTEVLAQALKPEVKTEKPIKTVQEISKKVIIKKEVPKQEVPKKIIHKKIVHKKVEPKKIKSKIVTRKTRVIRIKKGDTLNLIAQKYYGNSMAFKRIIRANKSIRSEKTPLKLGQKIIVPYLSKNKQRRMVTVKKGYSLAYISKKFYGTSSKVQKIVDANYNIKNKNSTLSIGQKIYVPR